MQGAHLPIAAFGGTFLRWSPHHFFDHKKDIHWIAFLEKAMSHFAPSRASKSRCPDPRAYLFRHCWATKKRRFSSIRRIYGLLTLPAGESWAAFSTLRKRR